MGSVQEQDAEQQAGCDVYVLEVLAGSLSIERARTKAML